MRTINTIIAAALLSSAGCASAPTEEYTVFIDPSFTADQQQDIMTAIGHWEALVPVTFHVQIGACDNAHVCVFNYTDSQFSALLVSYNYPTSGHIGVTFSDGHGDGVQAYVYLDTPVLMADGNFQIVAEHEFGHVQGLHHVQDVTQIMYPNANLSAKAATCLDSWHWFSVRSMPLPICNQP